LLSSWAMIPPNGFIDSSGQFASRKSLSTPGNWSLQLQKSAFIVLSSEIGGESACEQWVNSKNASECLLCASKTEVKGMEPFSVVGSGYMC
jgi:hypothetical protein